MQIYNVKQYSPEWWAHRAGIPTASRANEIVTPNKGDMSTQVRALINDLIAEKLGIQSDPFEATEWMQRGKDLEPEARAMFELEYETDVEPVGFITNSICGTTFGCSPDGLLDARTSGFEVKCPKPETQIGYLLGNKLPEYYKPQVHMSMAITGLPSWFFMSYHPDLEPLYVLVPWDGYTDKVRDALCKLAPIVNESMGRFGC